MCDIYAQPDEPITDYRTRWSGIRKRDMIRAIPVEYARNIIRNIIQVSCHLLVIFLNLRQRKGVFDKCIYLQYWYYSIQQHCRLKSRLSRKLQFFYRCYKFLTEEIMSAQKL